MREQTRRRLTRALWIERLRWIGLGLAALVAVAGVLTFTTLDARSTSRSIPAVVDHVEALNSKNAAQGLHVAVKLADGREIAVIMLRSRHPEPGEVVEIVERRHATGRISYAYK